MKMKATLDHIGIAVADLNAALAFYRDALGLEIEAPEDVASQHVRAHFIPAGRAALLQLAHPWVAASLDQHSLLLEKPIARFHNTFRVVFTMIFGSADQALRAARSLHQLHTRIRGEIPVAVARYAPYIR